MAEVSDATFQEEVVVRSSTVPVIVDLWAPWCGPCQTLGPILEQAVASSNGDVVLVKVNVDENPQISQTFKVQSIPAVFALVDGKVVDSFVGALSASEIQAFVAKLRPEQSELDQLIEKGDEASLGRALEISPDLPAAILALARLELEKGNHEQTLSLLARIPETEIGRALSARARLLARSIDPTVDVEAHLDALLELVKGNDEAKQEYVDILESLGPQDRRTAKYRKALATRLF